MKQDQEHCPFCDPAILGQVLQRHGTVFAIKDNAPVTPWHLLVLPHRHTDNYFSMTTQEKEDADQLILDLRTSILTNDSSVLGFNIGMNCGKAAGQTIMHAHIHLIPRRAGDTPAPQGGVRGVIPQRMAH